MSDFETCPVGTAKRLASLEPQPIVLPSLDEVREVLRQSEGRFLTDAAQAVLDLIASRVPVWVPVRAGTVIKAGTVSRVEGYDWAKEESQDTDWTPYAAASEPMRVFIDPRTVPAEPTLEERKVAVVAKELNDHGGCEDAWPRCSVSTVEHYRNDARDLLARLDALEADR